MQVNNNDAIIVSVNLCKACLEKLTLMECCSVSRSAAVRKAVEQYALNRQRTFVAADFGSEKAICTISIKPLHQSLLQKMQTAFRMRSRSEVLRNAIMSYIIPCLLLEKPEEAEEDEETDSDEDDNAPPGCIVLKKGGIETRLIVAGGTR